MLGPDFAGFRFIEFLGRGAFGETYKAERGGRLFAVKVLHESVLDSVDLARFEREAQALRSPSSEHLVECSDWGRVVSGGRTYHWLAMPFFEGRTLAQEVFGVDPLLLRARGRAAN